MGVMKFIIPIFFILNLHAAVIKNDVTGLKRKAFGLKEACEKAGFEHLLLVEAASPVAVDCMGRELNVQSFCEKIEGPSNLIRGFVSRSKSQVYCEYGEAVSLTLKCDQEHYKYCQNAKKGCEDLRSVFAKKLELMHSSFTGTPTNLNCHYSVSDPLVPARL